MVTFEAYHIDGISVSHHQRRSVIKRYLLIKILKQLLLFKTILILLLLLQLD